MCALVTSLLQTVEAGIAWRELLATDIWNCLNLKCRDHDTLLGTWLENNLADLQTIQTSAHPWVFIDQIWQEWRHHALTIHMYIVFFQNDTLCTLSKLINWGFARIMWKKISVTIMAAMLFDSLRYTSRINHSACKQWFLSKSSKDYSNKKKFFT